MQANLKTLFTHTMLSLCAISTYAGNVTAAETEKLWQIDQLDQPESVANGPDGHYLYISNINGQPMELNGLGYISRVPLMVR